MRTEKTEKVLRTDEKTDRTDENLRSEKLMRTEKEASARCKLQNSKPKKGDNEARARH